jgi:hypothetical protein
MASKDGLMKKRIFLYLVLFFTFLCMFLCFCFLTISESNIVFLIPSGIGLGGVACFLYLLFVEAIFGHNEYYYEAGKMYIVRKKRLIDVIDCNDVKRIVLIYDMLHDNLHAVSFFCNNKKHYIRVNPSNDSDILSFVEGKPCRKMRNYWYYIIAWL